MLLLLHNELGEACGSAITSVTSATSVTHVGYIGYVGEAYGSAPPAADARW